MKTAAALTDDELKLLRESGLDVRTASGAELWAFKRERQRRDIESIRQGRRTNSDMSWFTEEMARNAVIVDEPF
jgi:hypothetical protein